MKRYEQLSEGKRFYIWVEGPSATQFIWEFEKGRGCLGHYEVTYKGLIGSEEKRLSMLKDFCRPETKVCTSLPEVLGKLGENW